MSAIFDSFYTELKSEPIERNFENLVMPMTGKSDRNNGGVRIIFYAKGWPTASLQRLGCSKVLARFQSTPEIEDYMHMRARASSLVYNGRTQKTGESGLAEDLQTLGVPEPEITTILSACAGYWPSQTQINLEP